MSLKRCLDCESFFECMQQHVTNILQGRNETHIVHTSGNTFFVQVAYSASFTTDIARKQHACQCCVKFIHNYATLGVAVYGGGDESRVEPLLWPRPETLTGDAAIYAPFCAKVWAYFATLKSMREHGPVYLTRVLGACCGRRRRFAHMSVTLPASVSVHTAIGHPEFATMRKQLQHTLRKYSLDTVRHVLSLLTDKVLADTGRYTAALRLWLATRELFPAKAQHIVVNVSRARYLLQGYGPRNLNKVSGGPLSIVLDYVERNGLFNFYPTLQVWSDSIKVSTEETQVAQ